MKPSIILSLILLLSIGKLNAQNGLSFDGVDDRVDCGNASSLQLSGSAITLEAWIYPTAWKSQVWQGNIINKENNAPDYGYMLRCGSGGQLNFNLGGGSWNEISSPANTLSLNVWQHVAATYDGSMMRLYVNGLAVDSQASSVNFSSGLQNLTIGNWSNNNSRGFTGIIDEARVWNIVRTRAELMANMNTEFCAVPSGLVAYYQLNEGQARGSNTNVTTAHDSSGLGNDGTLTNFALSGSSSNWVAGSTILPAFDFIQIIDSTCTQYVGPSGQIWDSTGIYIDTLQNSAGCDSIIETDLRVNSVDNGVNATSNILVAAQNNASYQWLDCSNGMQALAGSTAQLLTPPDPAGSYAVIVNYRGCVDTSSCYQLQGIGLEEPPNTLLSIYPDGQEEGGLILHHPSWPEGHFRVINAKGELLHAAPLEVHSNRITSTYWPSGLYLFMLTDKSGRSAQLRWIKP